MTSAAVALLCFALTLASTTFGQPLVGGFQDIPDLNAPEVQDAANVATERLAAVNIIGLCPRGLILVSGQQQLVNGMNYKLTFTSDPENCNGRGQKQTCSVHVFISRDMTDKVAQGLTCQ